MSTEIKARLMAYYPVADGHLTAALAGRLLSGLSASKPDRGGPAWLYRDGFTAGVRWAAELAAVADLEQLADAGRQSYLVAPPWLRGFIDGALASWHETTPALVSR